MGARTTWTVLVVDDCADNACLLQLAAERVCSAVHFESALDAETAIARMEASRRKGGLPDLVLVDFNLPAGDGVGVLNWMKQQADVRNIPVLIWTGEPKRDNENDARSTSMRVLRKPGDMNEFRFLVRTIAGMLRATPPGFEG